MSDIEYRTFIKKGTEYILTGSVLQLNSIEEIERGAYELSHPCYKASLIVAIMDSGMKITWS